MTTLKQKRVALFVLVWLLTATIGACGGQVIEEPTPSGDEQGGSGGAKPPFTDVPETTLPAPEPVVTETPTIPTMNTPVPVPADDNTNAPPAPAGGGGAGDSANATAPIPDVGGLLAGDANNAIAGAGFAPQVVYEGTNCTPYFVVGQSPAAGTHAHPGSTVTVVVCPALTIPDVRGQDKGSAANILHSAGLTPVYAEATCDGSQPSGAVWATEPGAGSEVSQGASVTIFFYEGCGDGGGGGGDGGGGANKP